MGSGLRAATLYVEGTSAGAVPERGAAPFISAPAPGKLSEASPGDL